MANMLEKTGWKGTKKIRKESFLSMRKVNLSTFVINICNFVN